MTLTPRRLPVGRFYEVEALATYGELLRGVVGGLVPPEESADAWTIPFRLALRVA